MSAKIVVGAGTVTCNDDGVTKHRTASGSTVLISSNSTLVAPVTVADRAYMAAGSVITASDALALGRARQTHLEDVAAKLQCKLATKQHS